MPLSPRAKVTIAFYARTLIFSAVWDAILFFSAGSLTYWQAWVVLGILALPLLLTFPFWLKKDPELVARRERTQEKEKPQQKIVAVIGVCFLLVFIIPGFDRRFNWSDVPVWLCIAAQLITAMGYGICFLATAQNRFSSRTIQVEEGQPVISSGLYSVVRHPMYLGMLIVFLAMPPALGSYWALLPFPILLLMTASRIVNEEDLLKKDLKGYTEYTQKVKYRLIPGVW